MMGFGEYLESLRLLLKDSGSTQPPDLTPDGTVLGWQMPPFRVLYDDVPSDQWFDFFNSAQEPQWCAMGLTQAGKAALIRALREEQPARFLPTTRATRVDVHEDGSVSFHDDDPGLL